MRAAVTKGRGDIGIEEAPLPETPDYRCLCRIDSCATCSGTDLKIISGALPFEVPYPGIPGHESAGRVIRAGPRARNVREGDFYLRPAAVYPGEKLGTYHSCWGGFAEYGIVTDAKAFSEDHPSGELNNYTKYQQEIPPDINISSSDATMLITLKEASSFVSKIGVKLNSSLLILGSGPVGKSMCFFSKLLGASPVIVAGRREEPLEWVRNAGCDFTLNCVREDAEKRVKEITSGKGVNICIDTTGSPELVRKALNMLAPGGRIAPYATYPVRDCFKDEPHEKFIFAGPSENKAHDYLLFLLRNKLVEPKMFYSHTLPLSGIKEGFRMLEERSAFKIVFETEQ